MIKYDYGAVAKTFKLNTSTLAQSATGIASDFPNVGIHMQIGVSPATPFQSAWDQYVRETYTSLQAVANRNVSYTIAQLNAYLQACFLLDAALGEARRDLLMIQFRDVFSEIALADYFGPKYQTVYAAAQTAGTEPWFRWNSAAARVAAEFPHMHPKFAENYAYLLSNVFKDDTTGRWQFLYFHHFNQSLTSEYPDYAQALTAVEDMLTSFDATMAVARNPGLTREAVNQIRADLLNTFGAALNYDYGTVINFYSAPEPIYDADLVAQLNNWRIAPRALFTAGTSNYIIAETLAPSSASQAMLEAIIIGEGHETDTPWLNTGFSFRMTGISAVFDNFLLGLGAVSTVPVRITGTAFEGAAGLDALAFHEIMPAGFPTPEHVLEYKPTAPFGITFGQMWIVNRSPLDMSFYNDFLLPAFAYRFEGADYTTVTQSVYTTISAFNTSDVGNVIAYPMGSGGMPLGSAHYFSEPVQQWATISEASLMTYAAGAARALFDVGTTRLKVAKTSERVTRNNASAVNEGGYGYDSRSSAKSYRQGNESGVEGRSADKRSGKRQRQH